MQELLVFPPEHQELGGMRERWWYRYSSHFAPFLFIPVTEIPARGEGGNWKLQAQRTVNSSRLSKSKHFYQPDKNQTFITLPATRLTRSSFFSSPSKENAINSENYSASSWQGEGSGNHLVSFLTFLKASNSPKNIADNFLGFFSIPLLFFVSAKFSGFFVVVVFLAVAAGLFVFVFVFPENHVNSPWSAQRNKFFNCKKMSLTH